MWGFGLRGKKKGEIFRIRGEFSPRAAKISLINVLGASKICRFWEFMDFHWKCRIGKKWFESLRGSESRNLEFFMQCTLPLDTFGLLWAYCSGKNLLIHSVSAFSDFRYHKNKDGGRRSGEHSPIWMDVRNLAITFISSVQDEQIWYQKNRLCLFFTMGGLKTADC